MKRLLLLAAMMAASVTANAATVTAVLNWTRPATYVDGSPIPAVGTISGYRVMCMITPVGVENGTSCTPVPAIVTVSVNP